MILIEDRIPSYNYFLQWAHFGHCRFNIVTKEYYLEMKLITAVFFLHGHISCYCRLELISTMSRTADLTKQVVTLPKRFSPAGTSIF